MAAFVPLGIFLVEAVLIVIVGNALLWATAAWGDKMGAVWMALAIGVVMSIVVFLASRGGTSQTPATHGGGHH